MASPVQARPSHLQPNDWVRAGLAQLAREGVESVRVEVLARLLGVSKGSFYWHFADRDALLSRMLSSWEERETAWLAGEEANGEDRTSPATRWARFVEHCVEPDRIREEIGVRSWARKETSVAERVALVEKRKIRMIADVLFDVGFAREAADSWSEIVCLVYLGWLDRAARDQDFKSRGRSLGEYLSELVLAASAKTPAAKG
jgi:AcrR family transcriptional regulator